MKNLIYATFAIALLWCSCKKTAAVIKAQPGPVEDTLTATVDDTARNFNLQDSAKFKNTATSYSLPVSGKTASGQAISLDIFLPTPITTGTYILTTANDGTLYYPFLIYSINGGGNLANVYLQDVSGPSPVTINILSLDSTRVRGTFSGSCIQAVGTTRTIKTVANGKFNLPITR